MAKPIPPPDVVLVDSARRTMQDWYDFFRELLREEQALSIRAPVQLTYGPTVNIDAGAGNSFILTVTNGSNFTIAAPANPVAGAVINFTVRNTSGGGMGTVTWNPVFKIPSVPPSWKPPNGFSRSIQFLFDGINWIERYASTDDVPN